MKIHVNLSQVVLCWSRPAPTDQDRIQFRRRCFDHTIGAPVYGSRWCLDHTGGARGSKMNTSAPMVWCRIVLCSTTAENREALKYYIPPSPWPSLFCLGRFSSTNLAPIEESGVRFMCHPAIPLKDHLDLHVSNMRGFVLNSRSPSVVAKRPMYGMLQKMSWNDRSHPHEVGPFWPHVW